MNNRAKGIDGETAAMTYLINQGYLLLERNYKQKCGEIDLIAQKDGVIVFVEVKNRYKKEFGEPIEAVTPSKITNIVKTAKIYLSKQKKYDNDCRFDVIIVNYGEVEQHIQNAFTANDAGKKTHW